MANKLKVALLSEYPLTEDGTQSGGVISVAYALAHALARRDDVECHIVSSCNDVSVDYKQVGALHVHYVARPNLPRLMTDHLYDVPRIVRTIDKINPDVVHGQGQDRHGLAAVRSKRPNVTTPHGVAFIEAGLQKGLFGPTKGRLMVRNEQMVFNRSKHMIIISRYLPNIYGDMLTAERHFIENPIDPSFFDLDRQAEAGRLLFVGTVVPRKRVLDVIDSFDKLLEARTRQSQPVDHLQLRIVGPVFGDDYESQVRQRLAESGLAEQVCITGGVSQEQLVDEFRRAGMLLLASQEETAPQVIAQSLACGLPVVASRAGGVPYMVEHESTAMLFDPGDTEDCATQMNRLLNDADFCAQMSERVQQQALQRFHPDSIADQTVAVYRQVIDQA